MTRCPYPGSGCNGPKESDCVGLPACIGFSFHRIDTETMTKRCAAIKGNVEQRMPIEFADEPSRLRDAFAALTKWWKSNHGLRQAFRHALRAFRSAS